MAVRGVLFDLFDTLVDLFMEDLPLVHVGGRMIPSTHEALHELIVERMDIDFETFVRELLESDKALVKTTLAQGRELPTIRRFETLVQRLEIDDAGLPEALTQAHMGKIREQVGVVPHHAEILAKLHRGARIGICSNFSHAPTAQRILADAGLAPHIDCMVISEDVGIRKPRPEIFQEALRQLDVPAEETLHVGDRLVDDVAGASRLNLGTVWITRRVKDPETALRLHEAAPPNHIIADLADLLDLVA